MGHAQQQRTRPPLRRNGRGGKAVHACVGGKEEKGERGWEAQTASVAADAAGSVRRREIAKDRVVENQERTGCCPLPSNTKGRDGE